MAAVKTPKRQKNAAAAKPGKKTVTKLIGRKNLSPAMLDALVQHSPPHPAANEAVNAKPPFELQDD